MTKATLMFAQDAKCSSVNTGHIMDSNSLSALLDQLEPRLVDYSYKSSCPMNPNTSVYLNMWRLL